MTEKNLFLVGDSLIEFCDWQSLIPGHRVVNLGRSGETVAELLGRLPAILARRPAPHWLLLAIGTNNVCMEDFAFLPDYERLLASCRTTLPDTAVTVNSLAPVALPYLAPNVTARLNGLLRDLALRKGVDFLDVHASLTGLDGQPLPGVLSLDGVHLASQGYRLWAEAIRRHLQTIFP